MEDGVSLARRPDREGANQMGIWLTMLSPVARLHREAVTDAGFRLQNISRISDLGVDLLSDDIERQHLCILSR